MANPEFDLAVIGGGAGGLVVAAGGAKLGAKVALIEKDRLGGDSLWHGCVPSKTLIKSARVAHTMRHADRWALPPVDPKPDLARVMERVAGVVGGIAAARKSRAFSRNGRRCDTRQRQIRVAGRVCCRGAHDHRAAFRARHRFAPRDSADCRTRLRPVPDERHRVRAARTGAAPDHRRRRPRRQRDGAGVPTPRQCGYRRRHGEQDPAARRRRRRGRRPASAGSGRRPLPARHYRGRRHAGRCAGGAHPDDAAHRQRRRSSRSRRRT